MAKSRRTASRSWRGRSERERPAVLARGRVRSRAPAEKHSRGIARRAAAAVLIRPSSAACAAARLFIDTVSATSTTRRNAAKARGARSSPCRQRLFAFGVAGLSPSPWIYCVAERARARVDPPAMLEGELHLGNGAESNLAAAKRARAKPNVQARQEANRSADREMATIPGDGLPRDGNSASRSHHA